MCFVKLEVSFTKRKNKNSEGLAVMHPFFLQMTGRREQPLGGGQDCLAQSIALAQNPCQGFCQQHSPLTYMAAPLPRQLCPASSAPTHPLLLTAPCLPMDTSSSGLILVPPHVYLSYPDPPLTTSVTTSVPHPSSLNSA